MEQALVTRMTEAVAAFSEASGLMESTICARAVSDARFLADLRDGKAFTVRRHDRLMGWLRANWPKGHDRPAFLDPVDHVAAPSSDCGEDAAGAASCHVKAGPAGLPEGGR